MAKKKKEAPERKMVGPFALMIELEFRPRGMREELFESEAEGFVTKTRRRDEWILWHRGSGINISREQYEFFQEQARRPGLDEGEDDDSETNT